jgi:hypothetical protein
MNCQSFKNKIDEGVSTSELVRHLEACADCETFKEERECLGALLKKLEHVNAPANFEFALRAKLNASRAANNARHWRRRFAFASPALAAAAVSAFALSNYVLFAPPPTAPPQTAPAVAQTTAPLPTPFQAPADTNANSTALKTLPETAIALSPPSNLAPRDNVRFISNSDSPAKSPRRESRTPVLDRTIEESIQSKPDQASAKAESLYPNDVDPNKTQKVPVADALTFFGLEISTADGSVKSVRAESEAAQKGIAAGDVIETVNGQKTVGGNLGNQLKQVELDVVRGGERRTIVLTLKTELPK